MEEVDADVEEVDAEEAEAEEAEAEEVDVGAEAEEETPIKPQFIPAGGSGGSGLLMGSGSQGGL